MSAADETKNAGINPVLLVILDGWGIAPDGPGNAITQANPAFFNALTRDHPNGAIQACGEEVGLPADQFGNSEVGHLNLGAGRVVYQEITRIDRAVRDQSLFDHEVLTDVLATLEPDNPRAGRLHLMGLVSDGGVHSSDRHYLALLDWLAAKGFPGDRVFFHAITDGRDTDPQSGLGHLSKLVDHMAATGVGRIASISGRYFAMDRDQRWERTRAAWDVYTLGEGEIVPDAIQAIQASYDKGVTDEFITPKAVVAHGEPLGTIRDGDTVLWFNFRADRARQFCRALTNDDFTGFTRRKRPDARLVTMTPYANDIPADVLFTPETPRNTLGEWLASKGIPQLRTAETEKYAHVTYFFNGGVEDAFEREDRRLVNSPKVATYDLQPEMSAPDVAEGVVSGVRSGEYPFILVNFANPDMTGHTGIIVAAVAGIRAADTALQQVVDAATEAGYAVLVTADHGNADDMLHSGKANTAHSHNPVPFIVAGVHPDGRVRDGGRLCDVAPTVLDLMGLDAPAEMTGKSLFERT